MARKEGQEIDDEAQLAADVEVIKKQERYKAFASRMSCGEPEMGVPRYERARKVAYAEFLKETSEDKRKRARDLDEKRKESEMKMAGKRRRRG